MELGFSQKSVRLIVLKKGNLTDRATNALLETRFYLCVFI